MDWLSDLLALHERTGEIYHQPEITHWAPTRLDAVVVGHSALGITAQPSRYIRY